MEHGRAGSSARRSVIAVFVLAAAVLSSCGDGTDSGATNQEIAALPADLEAMRAAANATLAPRDEQIVWCHGHEEEVITAAEALRFDNHPGPRLWVWDNVGVPGLTGGTISRKNEVIVSPDWIAAWELWRDEHDDEWSRACKAAHDNRWYFLTLLN